MNKEDDDGTTPLMHASGYYVFEGPAFTRADEESEDDVAAREATAGSRGGRQ